MIGLPPEAGHSTAILSGKEPSIMTRILFILCLLIPVSAFSFQNEPNGFRTSTWNTPISQLAGLRPAGKPSGTTQSYLRLDEIFSHEGIDLYEIHYVAESGTFVEAVTRYDCAQYGALRDALKQKHGAATAKSQKGKALIWRGKITTINLGPPDVVTKKASPNTEPSLCSLTYASTPYLTKNAPRK
jgi:hypothetical protein